MGLTEILEDRITKALEKFGDRPIPRVRFLHEIDMLDIKKNAPRDHDKAVKKEYSKIHSKLMQIMKARNFGLKIMRIDGKADLCFVKLPDEGIVEGPGTQRSKDA